MDRKVDGCINGWIYSFWMERQIYTLIMDRYYGWNGLVDVLEIIPF
jgi:hypothetical protein